ncbi:hypothetical protein LINGRAHAP2_LOCUS34018 [Linum grandiflorum]
MKCFYFSSSLSNKLMAITTILLITVTTIAITVSGESYCSATGPGASGVCKDDYASCVATLLTQLRDTTPYTEHESFSTRYPADQPSHSIYGFAGCIEGSDIVECQSCLSDGIEWLGQNCAASAGGGYVGDICAMNYSQM